MGWLVARRRCFRDTSSLLGTKFIQVSYFQLFHLEVTHLEGDGKHAWRFFLGYSILFDVSHIICSICCDSVFFTLEQATYKYSMNGVIYIYGVMNYTNVIILIILTDTSRRDWLVQLYP
jgi:hypothetical protein